MEHGVNQASALAATSKGLSRAKVLARLLHSAADVGVIIAAGVFQHVLEVIGPEHWQRDLDRLLIQPHLTHALT